MAANEKTIELRDAFGQTLVSLGGQYPKLVVLDADLHTSSKAVFFKKAYPDRFVQVGIAEQNLFGVAAGLALSGFIPFPSTFAAFAARRALDQIAISICFPRLNVKIPGSYVGLPTSRAGASHNSIEDIPIMRSLPNMKVADPGDAADMAAVMRTAVETEGPVYFRVARYAAPILFNATHTFIWGKGEVIREGEDVTLFGTGIMTHFCVQAADLLHQDGVQAEVIHLASIKPIDEKLIASSAARTGCAVTAENGTILGGLGSAVVEVLGELCPVPLQRIGVRDRWVESGAASDLFAHHHMQPQDIANAARQVIAQKNHRKKPAKKLPGFPE